MFIQRLVLVCVIVAAAIPLAAQMLVSNGSFELTGKQIDDGEMPPNQIAGWQAAAGTPHFVAQARSNGENGFIRLRGNEAIRQPVSLRKGAHYRVSFRVRNPEHMPDPPRVALSASRTPLDDGKCPEQTCEPMRGARYRPKADGEWHKVEFGFAPSLRNGHDYTYLAIGATGVTAFHDEKVSWVDVDDVSIELVRAGLPAPLFNAETRGAIANQYIVVFKKDASPDELKAFGGRNGVHVLSDVTLPRRWLAVQCSPVTLRKIRREPSVLWVEANQNIASTSTRQMAPLGLDRIDRRLLPANGTFQSSETGRGVHVYVFDTGIRTTHPEFHGRASGAYPAFVDGHETDDCHGHGTHVAATIAGALSGVAEEATLHAVRVLDCQGWARLDQLIAAVEWLTENHATPAVANLSLIAGGISELLDKAVHDSIDDGVTYVVSAGNRADDACYYSPARVPEAITVGASTTTENFPLRDTRFILSNYGSCVDLFAPGAGIHSARNTDQQPEVRSGTSMAAAHVSGVAALVLELNPHATPADVWNRIHESNNVAYAAASTAAVPANWPGVRASADVGTQTVRFPSEFLHWASLNDGHDNGDPHLTTVDGTHYDFQSAGEFVLLRGGGVEIQTRQTPVGTMLIPGPDPYDGLTTCVSVNTAVAARVGSQRVSFQPGASGITVGMQLLVDGEISPLSPDGLDLADGGRVVQTAVGGGLEIQFPDGTVLTAVPGRWASQGKTFLDLHVSRTRATDGVMGAIAPGSWLPALPDGQSLGPMPALLHQRFVDLNQTFANAWRVKPEASLFDYASGTSTATFTKHNWPPENLPCTVTTEIRAQPVAEALARAACSGVRGKTARADCIVDVTVTGEMKFAEVYLLSQQLRLGGTSTMVTADKETTAAGENVTFTATVALLARQAAASSTDAIPTGSVQFFVNGSNAGPPVLLEPDGRASWTMSPLTLDTYRISARYLPTEGSEFLKSSSPVRTHVVR